MASYPKGFTGEKHPEVFNNYPPRSEPLKLGQLSDDQIKEFNEKGYLLVKNFFTETEIIQCREEVESLVEDLAQRLYGAGKITSLYKDKNFYDRLIHIEREYSGANIVLHKTPIIPKGFINVATNERLLNLLEDFLGPNITFNPVWNLRTKTPKNLATEVPWHQDAAYMDRTVYSSLIITAWIPLVNATLENGTMQMVKGAHKDGLVAVHECCAGPTWYISLNEEEMQTRLGANPATDSEILDVPVGSFILFNQFTPHRSLPNKSDIVRWSVDFRWNRTGSSNGVFGLKKGCEVRRADSSDFTADWNKFNGVDRNAKQHEAVGCENEEFSTTVMGPWMGQWNIINHNKHTAAFVDDATQWDLNMIHG